MAKTTDVRQVALETPFTDQKPGTSGLRKSSRQFQTPHYLESFIEASLRVVPGIEGGTLVVGGDGRFGNREAIDVIARMAAAHGVGRLITTTGGILSTPAASHLIRSRGAVAGIILSASHNPGGPEGDFGVKINGANGGPAPESLTDAIHAATLSLEGYRILDADPVNLEVPGRTTIGSPGRRGDRRGRGLRGPDAEAVRLRPHRAPCCGGTSGWPSMPCTPSPAPTPPGCSRACWGHRPAPCATACRWRISAAATPTPTSPTPTSWPICCCRAAPTTSAPPATATATAT